MNLQNIGPELTEDQKEELEKVREALKEMVGDRKIVVLGCGNHPVGYSTLSGLVNAETISLDAIAARPANNIIMIDNHDVDYAKFKIVKGRGHDKLKKKKKKRK